MFDDAKVDRAYAAFLRNEKYFDFSLIILHSGKSSSSLTL